MIIASFPKGSFPENSWPVGTWPVAPAVVDIQYTEVMEFAVCIATSAEFDVIMPNDESVAVTTGLTISGAGVAEVNGAYVQSGTIGGKAKFISSSCVIFWSSMWGEWRITPLIPSTLYYYSHDDVATPDLITNWESPYSPLMPTVESITAPTLTEVATFTVEMPMIIDFELYEELSA